MSSSPKPSNKRVVMQAAGIVAGAFLLSRIMGLVRYAVVTAYYGVDTVEATAYALASPVPELLFNVIAGGALGSAFIPTFAAYFVRDDEAGAWRLFSIVLNLVLAAMTVLAILTAVLAEPLVSSLFISAEDMVRFPDLLPVTVLMMRIMLMSAIVFGASGVFMAVLNARQHFLAPALAATLYNVGIIIGVVVWAPNVVGLAYGTVLGAVAHAVIQLPMMRRKGAQYTAVLNLHHPGVRRVLTLMGPRVLGLSFSQLNGVVLPILARPLPLGSLPALVYAFRVMLMPYSILGQAMGVAAFPTMSTLAAEKDWAELRRILASSLRSILFLGLPITAGLMLLSRPIVALLFERREFDAGDTRFVAWALLFYALALVALAALEVVSRTFYALEDTVTPVVAGMLQLPLMAALGALFAYQIFPAVGWLALGGLALGFSLSNVLEVGVLMWLLRRRIHGLNGRELLDGAVRMGAATAVMSGAVLGVGILLPPLSPLGETAVSGGVGAAVYLVACWVLNVSELRQFAAIVRRRLPF